ncbi:mRNA surveillance protein pelota [Sulfuracidifex metallicus]|uniref:mRNA surveillance protein pelota n=1 Tax=Sulfuracidifex metallicus TaxID=47303 RepID=UPI002274D57F|nr:mRNA surveillance protein pelota [Sulfuracidifex metallicus]MCY0850866.1 mRNA surveillance protein pelota [Sulfuracidifex metallicus]
MRILEFNEKQDSLTIHVENEDDLWLLYTMLKKDDEVVAKTLRDVSIGDNSRRVPMIIRLKVERKEFQEFTTRLRIHGIVLDAPEKYSVKGSHHTINLDIGDDITIIRKWEKYDLDKIYKHAQKKSRILISIIDIDECLVAIPMEQGIKILCEKSFNEPEESLLENAKIIADEIESYAKTYSPDAILIAGPGFFKQDVAKLLSKKYKVYTDDVNSPGRTGLNEVMKRDLIDQLIRDYEISEGTKAMDKFMEMLAKGSRNIAYGKEEVRKAAEIGAIDTVLVLAELIIGQENDYPTILNEVSEKGGKIILVPRDSPSYYQVKNIGGIVALLRFPI